VIVSCPTCGAPVEFRFDDSMVRVCEHCKAAVARTDRGADTLGTFADLFPLATPLRLFAHGTFRGVGFQLVGVAQLRHGQGGLWQEWFAKLADGRWGWLAEAQGRFYMTFERARGSVQLPPSTSPGQRVALVGERPFTVAEHGVASYVAAAGELPFTLTPGDRFRFADLDDGVASFATIDYGLVDDAGAPLEDVAPTLYVGVQLALAELGLAGGVDPIAERPRQGEAMACPVCGGKLELRVPDATLRIGCPYCGSLLDLDTPGSPLRTIVERSARVVAPRIPLGRVGVVAGVKMTVVGYLRRAALVGGSTYPFDEYLLHADEVGFRWLVEASGHWSLALPVRPGAVDGSRDVAIYDGRSFRAFDAAQLRVTYVAGECYWRVEVGETSVGRDYIAPPAMLSREQTDDELTWTLSTYLPKAEVERAFGVRLPAPPGIAPHQPPRWPGIGKVAGLVAAVSLVVAASFLATADNRQVHQLSTEARCDAPPVETLASPEGVVELPPAGAASRVVFSEPFHLTAHDNVDVRLWAPVDNNWIAVGGDLVPTGTSDEYQMFDLDLEYYSGVDGGESWSEGSRSATAALDAMPAGEYVLRLEFLCDPLLTRPVPVDVTVVQGAFRPWFWLVALLVINLPLLALWGIAYLRERARWQESGLA
jgi:hypothetical protein